MSLGVGLCLTGSISQRVGNRNGRVRYGCSRGVRYSAADSAQIRSLPINPDATEQQGERGKKSKRKFVSQGSPPNCSGGCNTIGKQTQQQTNNKMSNESRRKYWQVLYFRLL